VLSSGASFLNQTPLGRALHPRPSYEALTQSSAYATNSDRAKKFRRSFARFLVSSTPTQTAWTACSKGTTASLHSGTRHADSPRRGAHIIDLVRGRVDPRSELRAPAATTRDSETSLSSTACVSLRRRLVLMLTILYRIARLLTLLPNGH